MDSPKVECKMCGTLIRQQTAEKTGGYCRICDQKRRCAQRIGPSVTDEMIAKEVDRLERLRKSAPLFHGTLAEETAALADFLAASQEVGCPQVASSQNCSHRAVEDIARAVLRLDHELPQIRRETLDDFATKQVSVSFPWKPDFNGLIYPDLTSIFRDSGRTSWVNFRESFPTTRGIIEFSRIGFDRECRQALFSFGAQFDSLIGRGWYILMSREQQVWREAARVGAWMS